MSQPSDSDSIPPPGKIVLYQPGEDSSQIRVLLEGETVWLPQALIAELFQTTIPNVNLHLRKIYEEGELNKEATIKKYLIVQQEGKRHVSRKVLHYNLDAILAVGYRVKSPMATRFRQWATARLSGHSNNTMPSPKNVVSKPRHARNQSMSKTSKIPRKICNRSATGRTLTRCNRGKPESAFTTRLPPHLSSFIRHN